MKLALRSLAAWVFFLGVFLRYLPYRAGRTRQRPMFTENYQKAQCAWGQATRWNPRLRVVHPERCPQQGPVVFAGNHAKLDDPFFIWRSAHRATGETMHCRFVMRDDWGQDGLWRVCPWRFKDIGEMAGAVAISRGNVQYAQMKPLLQILQEDGAFIIFPGRTRTRSGLLIEYREGFDDPGGISFFLAQTQRKRPGVRVPAVPVCRTHNPLTWRSTVVFGEPLFLAPDADRAAQRQFDHDLVVAIGQLVEVQTLHLVALLIYFRCLHGRPQFSGKWLEASVQSMLPLITHPYVDPALRSETATQLGKILHFLENKKMLSVNGDQLNADPSGVLRVPDLDGSFRKRNPIRYAANQVLHLPELVSLTEEAVLRSLR